MKKEELPTIKQTLEHRRKIREQKRKLSKERTAEFQKKIKEY